jgi:hypothetical protein
MARRRLQVPLVLTVAVVGATLTACGGAKVGPGPAACPSDYYCTTDAARATACTDGGQGGLVYANDLGQCYPPV